MIEISLKPCPFCGGDKLGHSIKVSARKYNAESIYHCTVFCKTCHAYGNRVLGYSDEKYKYTKDEEVAFKKLASEAWNTRPLEDKCVNAYEGLQKKSDMFDELVEVLENDDSGDLDFILFRLKQIKAKELTDVIQD